MMKLKKEYLILAFMIAALLAYLLLRSEDRTRYTLPAVAQIDTTSISKIELGSGDNRLVLEKKDDQWVTSQGFKATPRIVSAMLDALEKLTPTALISESRDYIRYDLNPGKKITVKAWADGKQVRDFAVGKAADSFRHTYIMLAGDDRVYQVQDNIRNTFDQTADALRDKTVLAFNASDIHHINLTGRQQNMAFSRQKAPLKDAGEKPPKEASAETAIDSKMVWRTPEGQTGDEAKLSRLLDTLSRLECDAYMDDKKKEDFSDPIYRLELSGPQTHYLEVFANTSTGDTRHPAVSSASDTPFFLPEWRVKELTPDMTDLISKSDKS